MKKVSKLLMTLLPSVFLFGLTACETSRIATPTVEEKAGEDSAVYDQCNEHAKLDEPDITNKIKADDEEEGEETEVVVNKVILHYYNEAGGNKGRAFYLWVTGQDGVEYNIDNATSDSHPYGNIITYSADETMMTITIDFTKPAFKAFAGKSKLFFIIKYKMVSSTNLNWGGQSDDMQLVYSEFPPKKDETCEVWTMPAAGGGIAILDSEEQTKVHGIQLAKFTSWKTISCELTKDTKQVDWKLYAFDETYFRIKPKKRPENQRWYLVKEGSGRGNFNISLKYDAHINMVYQLVSHDPSTDTNPKMKELSKTVTIGFDKLYESTKFNTYYEAANKSAELGAFYTPQSTTFRVWSPVSANMTVMLYDSDTSKEFGGDDLYTGYHMHYHQGGIWELTIDGNLKGKYYNYQVDNTLGTNVTMDPYATSAGACGVRGFIYDKAESNPEGWDNLPLRWDSDIMDSDIPNRNTTRPELNISTPQDLTIYEVHMQDFTGDESWVSTNSANPTKRGTYNAFVEGGTRLPEHSDVTTGYDHLKELGIKAVQLVPVFDSDNDESGVFDENGNPTKQVKYNWGYNPLNYNVVEGGYSSNPHDGMARVKEFKNMVLELSKARTNDEVNTRVIMDVVYNHVSSATGSCFHKLMPRYYFRYAQNDYYYTNSEGKSIKYQSAGELWDGSGCHNEVASERPMMRKFIIDSLKMWATEYKIKGFRFDLMGLIDFQTLNEAKKELYKIDPDIYMYGEGWSLGYHGEGSSQWNYEHGSSPHNFGTENWQIYNECNNFIAGNDKSVYLGGFNNAFRDAVRGDNGSTGGDGRNYPNANWVQMGNWRDGGNGYWYVDTGTLDRIAKGMWGSNGNVNTDGAWTGYYPEQTINYVSCHDNWTVRDQLYQTMHGSTDKETAERVIRGSLQAHSLVFASNTPAFILGGEEFFRTKELTNAETLEVTEDSWTSLYSHNISHNSYNAPLRVNTFKWGNKVEATFDSFKAKDSVYNYMAKFKDLIKMHDETPKKRGENKGADAFYSKTSAGNNVTNLYWSQEGNFSNCIAFQVNETFIYTCAGGIGAGDYIQCKDSELNSWPLKFSYGSTSHSNDRFYFSDANAVQIYVRG